jgi:hypothetical protein
VDSEAVKSDKWAEYFASIRKVCPWSGQAYKMSKILFVETNGTCLNTWAKLFTHTKHEAYVYTWPDASVEWLQTMCEGLNKIYDTEWLWSHPAEGGDSTHIPVLIQQDATQLAELREKIGYVEQD